MRFCWRFLWCGVFLGLCHRGTGLVRAAEPMAEIVVANRYLQQTGVSHAHLYLYRVDGKLLRQLTKDDGGQDTDPVFAPDGGTVVFTRELPDKSKQWWSVEPLGKNLRRLDAAPAWYAEAKSSPAFDHSFGLKDGEAPETPADEKKRTYQFAGGGKPMEVVLTPTEEAGQDPIDEWNVHLRGEDGKAAKLGTMPGWFPEVLGCREEDGEKNALAVGTMRTAFIATSLGSTDGATVHAFSLDGKRLTRLAHNGATPFPLPGEPAFLSSAQERYVPFGDGGRTANCSYVDRWDATWKPVRYAREKAAAICYGASLYRPGKVPAVVTIRADAPE